MNYFRAALYLILAPWLATLSIYDVFHNEPNRLLTLLCAVGAFYAARAAARAAQRGHSRLRATPHEKEQPRVPARWD